MSTCCEKCEKPDHEKYGAQTSPIAPSGKLWCADCSCHAPTPPTERGECGKQVLSASENKRYCISPKGHEYHCSDSEEVREFRLRHAQPPVSSVEEGEWENIEQMLQTFKMYNGTDFCALCGLDPVKLRDGIRQLLHREVAQAEVRALEWVLELVGDWKEPEWTFERHEALIDHMTAIFRHVKERLAALKAKE